ncbi:MAG: CapA family protein [Fimbriimonadaceae bacterium]|nr:CapA family protein [Fimbriimonadaceae bacterium]
MTIDWNTGSWHHPQPPAGRRWRLVIAGDWGPRAQYADLLATDPVGVYGDLLPWLTDHDLRIVNVEVVLSQAGEPILKDGPNLRGRADSVAALRAVPFDVATLCNNHIHDYGPEGLRETLQVLHEAGLETVGAGLTQAAAEAPLCRTVAGVPVAIVNAGEGEENRCRDGSSGVSGFDEERLAARVRDLRATGHVVIAVVHAGREYTPLPPPYIQAWYRRLADAGAHLVVGGHPHVPQGVEWRHGCPIAYSTGNFLFWMDQPPKARQGYLVQAEFVDRTLVGYALQPYLATPAGVRRLSDAERPAFWADLAAVSAPLTSPAAVQQHWEAAAVQLGPGLLQRAGALLDQLTGAPLEGARKLRNLFDTPAHRELILTWLRLLLDGRCDEPRPAAQELWARWRA